MLRDTAVSERKAIPRLIRAAAAGAIGLATAGGLAAFAAGPGRRPPGTAGAVYTMTNSASGNAIEAFARASDGTLTPAGTYPTGGDGGALDGAHSIVVSRDGSVLVNVNAGSNSISAFAVTPRGLRLIGTASSGGTVQNSVTIAGDNVVYVLNAGSETIAGFRLSPGRLGSIPHSVQPLGAGALVPKQIQFTNDGRVLVVTKMARTPSTPSWSAPTRRRAQRSSRRRPAAARSGSTSTGPATCWSPTRPVHRPERRDLLRRRP